MFCHNPFFHHCTCHYCRTYTLTGVSLLEQQRAAAYNQAWMMMNINFPPPTTPKRKEDELGFNYPGLGGPLS